ncbi:transporter substrate-binding domain-containing protein [Vibrio sp. SM6]|uniref:Transporter substrate-binding domain-containing protein n=1 Tax=Vibrio agarilyticus TaxID=2726741 RepID=A0A7X8TQ58_9VIBR|nr:HD domain-containing phosphohydrolase [Vibrio agarilyticus]NLS12616.1 transporter substrate-binding domain-containing protein [Vibrio agarilyticus]
MDKNALQPKKYSIRVTVVAMFVIATAITAMLAVSLQYYFGRQMARDQVLNTLTQASSSISEYVQEIDVNASSSATMLQALSLASARFSEQEVREILTRVLKTNDMFYSLYFGMPNEDFYQVINLASSPVVRERIDAGKDDRWVIVKITGDEGQRVKQTSYYRSDFTLTKQLEAASQYYPTARPWYRAAVTDVVTKTEPYLFHHLKITGQTFSVRGRYAVIGVDIVLSAVNSKITPEAMGLAHADDVHSYVFSRSGEIIASNVARTQNNAIPAVEPLTLSQDERQYIDALPPLRISNQNDWAPYDYSNAGEPEGYAVDVLKMVASSTGIDIEFINGFSWGEHIDKYNEGQLDVLQSAPHFMHHLGIRSEAMYSTRFATATLADRAPIETITALDNQRVAVVAEQGFEQWLYQYLYEESINPNVLLFDNLKSAYEALSLGDVDVILNSYPTLVQLQSNLLNNQYRVTELSDLDPMTLHFYMQPKQQQLMGIMNRALASFTPDQKAQLQQKWLSQQHRYDQFLPYKSVLGMASNSKLHNTMHLRVIDGVPSYVYVTQLGQRDDYFAVIVPEHQVMGQVMVKLWQSIFISVFAMILILPIAWLFASPIVNPILALIKETKKIKRRQLDKVQHVNTRISEVAMLSNAIVKMSREIRQHEKDQEDFIEAFIRLIAQAIDDKSPYTAGHCNRVPELGMMLASAAEASNDGPFAHFKFANDDERREFRIAAWLHDCGKITTPEHIVDKGTKLEANYNRIHEIRTRFEVLWRDAEIDYLRECQNDPNHAFRALAKKQARQEILQDEFEFVARANVGGEFMAPENVARIEQIGQQTWVRHFDNTLGLSPLEESKMADLNAAKGQAKLPATETLLADRDEHIIERDREVEFDPALGIKMDVPEFAYNLGEIYNLSISRGTLTTEDRYKINEHMISGIKMLDALPFPKELQRVPRYASTHHETLKGTGYPRKLTADDLSTPERILVIADIFEALTAADRPYKKAKPLSVAVDILYQMALDEHVDMALFKLFLSSGTYLEYARMFLPQAQIDDVDVTKYLDENKSEITQ